MISTQVAEVDDVRPLHEACAAGHADVVALLLRHGADPTAPAAQWRWCDERNVDAPFAQTFGSPLEICEESGDAATAALVRARLDDDAQASSLSPQDVADFATVAAARRTMPRPSRPADDDDDDDTGGGERTTRAGLWDDAGLPPDSEPATALRRLRARFHARREACMRAREPGLWAAYVAWQQTDAGTWWRMSMGFPPVDDADPPA